MPIVKTISEWDFIQALEDDFSLDASKYLYDYYDDQEKNWELDCVAIRCEWEEFDDVFDLYDSYSWLIEKEIGRELNEYKAQAGGLDEEYEEEVTDVIFSWLQKQTVCVMFDMGGILMQKF